MVINKKILLISFAVIVAAIGVTLMVGGKKAGPAPGDSPTAEGSGPASAASQVKNAEETPLQVRVASVRKGELVIKLKSPGEAVTDRKVVLKAEVGGVIKSLDVEEGRRVAAGSILAVMDDESYRLELEKLEAQRLRFLSEMLLEREFDSKSEGEAKAVLTERTRKAQEDFEKADALFRQGRLSRQEFEKASRDYELVLIETGMKKDEIMAASKGLTQAEIEVKIAKMQVEKTRVRAPFSGIVTEIKVVPGERVEPGRDLFTLVNVDRIRVLAKVLESEIGRIRVGHEADLRFSAYPDKAFKGKVSAVSPVVDPEDKTCAVHIAVENPGHEIKPGMHAEVEIAAEIFRDRLLVPQEAVLVRGGRKLVFVVEGGLAKWRYIEIGLENENEVEVLDGVKESEPVIVEGHFTLAHDARVRIVE